MNYFDLICWGNIKADNVTQREKDLIKSDIAYTNNNTKFDNTKVIINDNATILIDKNGKKYISKPNEKDTFDKEKGIMMCMLKALGYTYSDVEKLLKNAKEYK